MDEKVTLQYLIEIFSKENRIAKDWGDSFVKAFFDLIREGLEKDRIVKIKGLGTFKIIDIEPRESVNVNTGERFQIEGHNKVSFTPDASLKEVVNQPFADFETVILNEGVSFDNKQDFDMEAFDETNDEAADNETTDSEVEDTEAVDNKVEKSEVNDSEPIGNEAEENGVKNSEVAVNEIPDNETASDNNSEIAETETTAVADGISESVLSNTIAEAESMIKEIHSEQLVQENAEGTKNPEEKRLKEEKEENRKSDEPAVIEEPSTRDINECKQEKREEPSNSQSNIEKYDAEPTATKTEKTLGTSAADKIIAHELMQAPPSKVLYIEKANEKPSKKKKKKKRIYINPSVAMGILTVLIIGAFGIIVYWMLAPESTDTEIKPLYNSSTGNSDAMANDSLNNNKDTLTLAEKALLLAQEDQATDSDDSNKIRTAMLLLNAERDKKKPIKSVKAETSIPQKVHKTPTKASVAKPKKETKNKIIIKGLKTTHVMAKGENLYTIAKQYLGSKDKVKYLIKYNKFKNPDLVKIGTKVRIPALSE
ncbi:MAG: LysM peptidoglycan-binding domain-containing protein [Bacteroidales bacterium]|nr:LysM peptidoglycan-binding domain-containing protein [Bacteroidales bacterium]